MIAKSLHEKLSVLLVTRQSAIQQKMEQLLTEEMILRDLRLALKKKI